MTNKFSSLIQKYLPNFLSLSIQPLGCMFHRHKWTSSKFNSCLFFPLSLFYLTPSLRTPSLKPKPKVVDLTLDSFSRPLQVSVDGSSICFPMCSILTICTSTILLSIIKQHTELCFLSWAQFGTWLHDNAGYLLFSSPIQEHPNLLHFALWEGSSCPISTGFVAFCFLPFNGNLGKETGTAWSVNSGVFISSFLSLLSLHTLETHTYCQVIFTSLG